MTSRQVECGKTENGPSHTPHGRLRTRNTNISPHVVSDPRQRRRSMSSVAVFTPSRTSLRVRTLRRHAAQREIVHEKVSKILAGSPMFRVPANSTSLLAPLLPHPVAVLHVGAQSPHSMLPTGISRESYDEKSNDIHFRMFMQCLNRLGDIKSGCAKKTTLRTSTGCLTYLLYLVSTWFDPCSHREIGSCRLR